MRAKAGFVANDRQPVERTLFKDYATKWLDSYVGRTSQPISETTRAQYRDAIKRKALPYFNAKRLGDIRPSDIRAYIDHLGRDLEPGSETWPTSISPQSVPAWPLLVSKASSRRTLQQMFA